jgi:hypothetical protein
MKHVSLHTQPINKKQYNKYISQEYNWITEEQHGGAGKCGW